MGGASPDGWHADLDFDSAARGRYIDALIAATRPGCHDDSYCADECPCQSAAAIAAASNPYTATRLTLPDCCGDPGDCQCHAADPAGGARP